VVAPSTHETKVESMSYMSTANTVRRCVLLAIAVAIVPASQAAGQTLVTETGTPFVSTLSTAAFSTRGQDMGGMLVTAFFDGGASASGSWGFLGGAVWGVETSSFRLGHLAGNFTGAGFTFFLSNYGTSGLSRLVLSGAPGRTVFDLTIPGGEGTPGSSSGARLRIMEAALAANATVTYRNVVSVGASAPVGDIYEQVDLFLGTPLAGGQSLNFELDTDNLPFAAVITPAPTTVPEPATWILVSFGLVVMGGARTLRRRAR
jgi:hypothetical protein